MSHAAISQPNPPITPKWALGHVIWENSLNTQQAAESLVRLYKENNIPVGAIVILRGLFSVREDPIRYIVEWTNGENW